MNNLLSFICTSKTCPLIPFLGSSCPNVSILANEQVLAFPNWESYYCVIVFQNAFTDFVAICTHMAHMVDFLLKEET